MNVSWFMVAGICMLVYFYIRGVQRREEQEFEDLCAAASRQNDDEYLRFAMPSHSEYLFANNGEDLPVPQIEVPVERVEGLPEGVISLDAERRKRNQGG